LDREKEIALKGGCAHVLFREGVARAEILGRLQLLSPLTFARGNERITIV